jgi:hypothetical protein|tara:strand:- start:88 stop:306 length:219 start_codon:yes stop_codon:yes gene_type:complete
MKRTVTQSLRKRKFEIKDLQASGESRRNKFIRESMPVEGVGNSPFRRKVQEPTRLIFSQTRLIEVMHRNEIN